jgi:hypothetical protein
MNYRPLFPHAKIVRTGGIVKQTALVIFWRGWVVTLDTVDAQTVSAFFTFLALFILLWLALIVL